MYGYDPAGGTGVVGDVVDTVVDPLTVGTTTAGTVEAEVVVVASRDVAVGCTVILGDAVSRAASVTVPPTSATANSAPSAARSAVRRWRRCRPRSRTVSNMP